MKQYRIHYRGAPDGNTLDLVKQFGPTLVVEKVCGQEQSDVFVVDCHFAQRELTSRWIRSVLNAGQTLGLLNLSDCARTALSAVTGRTFRRSIHHIFVRRGTGGRDKFTYTIVPARESLLSEPPEQAANYLRRRVFTTETAGNPPEQPPEPTNLLWPSQSLLKLSGSIVEIADRQPCSSLLASFNFSSKAYCYRDKGTGSCLAGTGNGDFHVIILSQIEDASPSNSTDGELNWIEVGYAIRVIPKVNGNQMTTGVRVQPPSPQPTGVGSNSQYGAFIETDFGTGTGYPVSLEVCGVPPSGEPLTIQVTPMFQQKVGQAAFPTVGSFNVSDSADSLQVRFFTEADALSDGTSAPDQNLNPNQPANGHFVTVHYLVFKATPGESTLPITFDIEILQGLKTAEIVGKFGGTEVDNYYETTTTISREIDLYQATVMQDAP